MQHRRARCRIQLPVEDLGHQVIWHRHEVGVGGGRFRDSRPGYDKQNSPRLRINETLNSPRVATASSRWPACPAVRFQA